MYLRHTTRKKDGKVHRYWRLVRSVRVGRRVIQRTVAHLGELDERGRLEARAFARRLIGTPEQADLFEDGCRDAAVAVRLKGVRIEQSRQFGNVYLGLALWRGTGLAELCERLLPAGKEQVAWAKMAAVLVVARLCEPSSELHIAEDWYRRTALPDLLQLDPAQVNKDRLYRALDALLVHKGALEAHLSRRCGELFATQNEVLLYDVTSTFFECQSARKRDPRSACKKDPLFGVRRGCPGSEQEGPARAAQCPHERRSGARGRCPGLRRGRLCLPTGGNPQGGRLIAAEALGRFDRLELVEVEVVDGLQRLGRGAFLKAFGQDLEPSAIFGLKGEQDGDGVVPAPNPAAVVAGSAVMDHRSGRGAGGAISGLSLGIGHRSVGEGFTGHEVNTEALHNGTGRLRRGV